MSREHKSTSASSHQSDWEEVTIHDDFNTQQQILMGGAQSSSLPGHLTTSVTFQSGLQNVDPYLFPTAYPSILDTSTTSEPQNENHKPPNKALVSSIATYDFAFNAPGPTYPSHLNSHYPSYQTTTTDAPFVPEEPFMNFGGTTTKHNWIYNAPNQPPHRNSQRALVCKDIRRHYRATFCCNCQRMNHGWYSDPQADTGEEVYKTCADCQHVYGMERTRKCKPECCNPEWAAWFLGGGTLQGIGHEIGGINKKRSVDDWGWPEVLPTKLQIYEEP